MVEAHYLAQIHALDNYIYERTAELTYSRLVGFHTIPYHQALVVLVDYEDRPRQYFGWFIVVRAGTKFYNESNFGLVATCDGFNVYQRREDETYRDISGHES